MSRTLRWFTEGAIAAVVIFNIYQAVWIGDWTLRAPSVALVIVLVYLSGLRHGHRRLLRSFEQEMAWLPEEIVWHTDDADHRHALVTQQDGTIRSIEMPDEIENSEQAIGFILNELKEERT